MRGRIRGDTMRSKLLETSLLEELEQEEAFIGQTVKAINHYEQYKQTEPHIEHLIVLLHVSHLDSEQRIDTLKRKLNLITQPETTTKYGSPYMEK
jgi:hypothetical protein